MTLAVIKEQDAEAAGTKIRLTRKSFFNRVIVVMKLPCFHGFKHDGISEQDINCRAGFHSIA